MGSSHTAVPQNTEGAELITCAITPKSASNLIIIQFFGACSWSYYGENLCTGLFRDDIASALTAQVGFSVNGNNGAYNFLTSTFLSYKTVAGSIAATTFKIRFGLGYRVGPEIPLYGGLGGAGTWGGALRYGITILEVAV
jgi:hypothetical protein